MHVLRPLALVVALVVIVLVARLFLVPADFGIQERGYTYGWHRQSDEDFWASSQVKYRGSTYCQGCHGQQHAAAAAALHAAIECENCHGPAVDHPSQPPKLQVDRGRELCLRCHARLPYSQTDRQSIKGIPPETHNAGIACVTCHNPHSPKPGGGR